MAYVTITEGSVRCQVPKAEKVSAEMEVFYNPTMKLNRDISLLLLEALGRQVSVASPLAGTGVRECRMLVELSPGILERIEINDNDEKATSLIRKNIAMNEKRLRCNEIEVSCNEASKFLLSSAGFGYIDLDPFGTPNPFLDAAVKRVQREGVLAITATDTAALAGTYPSACLRKYWAVPMRNHLMHEVGLRILIRKVQLVGCQYEKALLPIYSLSKEHYMRIFFHCAKGKKGVESLLKQHAFLHHNTKTLKSEIKEGNRGKKDVLVAGPLWTGHLWDRELAEKMAKLNRDWAFGQPENQKLLDTLALEAASGVIGFYPFNTVRKILKRTPRKKAELLQRKGVWPTHLEGNAVRATALKLLF